MLQVCNPGEAGKGVSLSMTNVHSQTNGQQSQTCTVTPSASKHGSTGLDELSGSNKKRGGAAGGGGKETGTQSSDSSLRDCAAATSVLSQSWAARSLTAEDKEDRGQPGGATPGAASLNKPKRKPAPSKPGSVCSSPSAASENPPASSHRPPSSTATASSVLLPSSTPLENHNTNRNNSTSLDQTPPPPPTPSPFSSPRANPSPAASIRFRETPVLRRAPRASAKYQTLPVEEEEEEEGQNKARRRYSLSEGGSTKTPPSLQGGRAGTAPRLGRIMRNKRSQSMSGMLLPKDGDGDSDKARCDSDWILESTV